MEYTSVDVLLVTFILSTTYLLVRYVQEKIEERAKITKSGIESTNDEKKE